MTQMENDEIKPEVQADDLVKSAVAKYLTTIPQTRSGAFRPRIVAMVEWQIQG
jgi:hypothetical protein